MAKKILNNLETYGVIRNKINDNFTDLYDNKSNKDHSHTELHTHDNKNVLDSISQNDIIKWNSGSGGSADGTGTGDMTSDVYDPQGKAQDIFAYADSKIAMTEKGAVNGVATLGADGKVPSEQLPPISSSASDITYDNTASGLIAEKHKEQ